MTRCKECGAETDHVAIWDGKPVTLCAECSAAIRSGELRRKLSDEDEQE